MGKYDVYLDLETQPIADKIMQRGRGVWSQTIRRFLLSWQEENLTSKEGENMLKEIEQREKQMEKKKEEIKKKIQSLKEKEERLIKETKEREEKKKQKLKFDKEYKKLSDKFAKKEITKEKFLKQSRALRGKKAPRTPQKTVEVKA